MKKLFLGLLLALCAVQAEAQPDARTFSLIPKIGVALSNVSHESIATATAGGGQTLDSRYREGVVGGVDLQYQATDRFAFSLGAMFSRQGCSFKETDQSRLPEGIHTAYNDCRMSLDYIDIPLMAHAYLFEGFSVNVGVQPAFLVNSNLHMEERQVTVNHDGSFTFGEQSTTTNQDVDALKKFDFSIPIGISYEYANVVLDFRYNIGLTNLYKAPLSDQGSKNRSFFLTVGYKLGL